MQELATELWSKKSADLNDYEPCCQFYMSENNPFYYTLYTDYNCP